MIHETQLSVEPMFNVFTDKDENEKIITQSSDLGGEEIGQGKDTERKRNMEMREQVLTNQSDAH